MEKGTLGLIAAGGVAIFAFFSLTQTNSDERREIRSAIAADAASIDAEFARLTGAPAAQQNSAKLRAEALATERDKIKTETDERRRIEEAKRGEVQSAAEAQMQIELHNALQGADAARVPSFPPALQGATEARPTSFRPALQSAADAIAPEPSK